MSQLIENVPLLIDGLEAHLWGVHLLTYLLPGWVGAGVLCPPLGGRTQNTVRLAGRLAGDLVEVELAPAMLDGDLSSLLLAHQYVALSRGVTAALARQSPEPAVVAHHPVEANHAPAPVGRYRPVPVSQAACGGSPRLTLHRG